MVNRVHRRALTALLMVMVVGMVASWFTVRKERNGIVASRNHRTARNRQELFSHTDALEYWYRFTPLSGWKCDQDYSAGLDTNSFDFRLTSPAPMPRGGSTSEHGSRRPYCDPVVYITAASTTENPRYQIVHGFPEWSSERMRQYETDRIQVLHHRHLRIDGYPTTVIECTASHENYVVQTTSFIVYAPDHATFYTGDCFYDPSVAKQYNRAMQAIISSFHIERVAVETGGTR